MVITRSGAAGLSVACHVMEELRLAFAHAPIPHLQTVVKTAEDWDELKTHANVTHLDAQVKLSCAKVERIYKRNNNHSKINLLKFNIDNLILFFSSWWVLAVESLELV